MRSQNLLRVSGENGTMVNMIQRDSTILAAGEDEVVSCDIAGEAALLDLRSGSYYGLDAVGNVVWGLAKSRCSVNEMLHTLLQRYDVEPQRCEQDLLALLNQLAEAGLITVDLA